MRIRPFILFIALFNILNINLNAQYYTTDTVFANNAYWKRLKSLPNAIKPYFDEQIENEIKLFLNNPKTPAAIAKYHYYSDSISKIFDKFGLPKELQLIAFANTLCDDNFLASTGETGQWPLQYFIGKKYQLIINSFVDERRDIYASSLAAAKSLADLYHIYKDWYFTIAAFRSGPVAMNKAMRLASNAMDYFTVEPYIDESYRKSFSKFMAALYVVNFYSQHNIKLMTYKSVMLDTVAVTRTFTFQRIAESSNTPLQIIRQYNSKYKNEIVPNFPYPHIILLPLKGVDSFKKHLAYLIKEEENKTINDSLERVKKLFDLFRPDTSFYKILVLDGKLTVIDSLGNPVNLDKPAAIEVQETNNVGIKWIYYSIKTNDNLPLIADCFDVTVTDIKKWNKLSNNNLVKGKRLKIMIPANKFTKYNAVNTMNMAQKQKLRKKD